MAKGLYNDAAYTTMIKETPLRSFEILYCDYCHKKKGVCALFVCF